MDSQLPAKSSELKPVADVTIRCRRDGPLVIEGAVQVVDHQGRPFPMRNDKPLLALCRCGHSANKPFCDGAHRQSGFVAGETASTSEMP